MSELSRPWQVQLSRQAEKTLYRLSKSLLRRIDRAILALAENPHPPGCRRLANDQNLYRLPVGDWCFTYAVEETGQTVLILDIARKRQVKRYRMEEETDELIPEPAASLETGPDQPDRISVLIVDDMAETRENLSKLLFIEPDLEVVGAAASGEEAIKMAVELQPDIILMDIMLPGLDGLTTTQQILQQVPQTRVIMMSVHGEADVFRRAMLAGAKEFLIKPFSGDELIGSIRRVYRPGASRQHLILEQIEGTIKLSKPALDHLVVALKQHRLGERVGLGEWVEISLSVADLAGSLSFYEKIGLKKVDGGPEPYPWAIVSDGVLHLGLHQQSFASPTLSYFSADRSMFLERIDLLGGSQRLTPWRQRNLILTEDLPGNVISGEFSDPEGQRIVLAAAAYRTHMLPARKFFSKADMFGEISLPTKNVQTAVTYWKRLGFTKIAGSDRPYPWATLSDGLIRLSFHQARRLVKPLITYFAPDMPDRLNQFHDRGLRFISERKDSQGCRVGAAVRSPDGQLFLLFKGEMRAPYPEGKRRGKQDLALKRTSPPEQGSPARPEGAQWYRLYCYSGHQNKVKENLLHRVESMSLQDRIFQVVAVGEEAGPIAFPGGSTVYPGCLLIEMLLDEDSWYVVQNTPGVTGFAGTDRSKPTPLDPAEVHQILNRLDTEIPPATSPFKSGQVVRITAGPFADFMGTVDQIDLDRARVSVLINFFGREMPIELDFSQVERA